MERKGYDYIPTTYKDADIEEWRYTTLYTDIWNFEILMSLEDLKKDLSKWWEFKYRKLEEYSAVLEHYWELVLDLDKVKILWYKEHIIIDNLKKQRELNEEKTLEVNE